MKAAQSNYFFSYRGSNYPIKLQAISGKPIGSQFFSFTGRRNAILPFEGDGEV
jgi:hypothetical protein